MCHGQAVEAFPEPTTPTPFDQGVSGYRFGDSSGKSVAILPDIYGCNEFYQGLSAHLAQKGKQVYLVDTFAGLGDLSEQTREAAFARRNRVADKTFLDSFEDFCADVAIDGVIGFCLGGLYVFELARRGVRADLLGLYGFPQGLPNQDALPVPFEYLSDVEQPFSMLLGADDESVGKDNIGRLAEMTPNVPAMNLTIYEGVGHNFLPLLDSDQAELKAVAEDALRHIENVAG
ncbi:carboxymethylenebutenolidase [Parasphingorhabdus marina DSM 22363]|uniref:Carboxymethylenebutenolidase n=1 Tax=Parasphingorhabdus marina DSM 22363 TaxID=1123272 RepID=A0A1N6D9U5_9SPHN|nr:dienelactone hydrolase family protein [Parasphingorhabdus marina]SIN67558.1 carboxymethylenebutenolidase [Parasphingorhabdus marina DSM 22363]